MPAAERTVTLPPDVADLIEHRLRSGAHASAGDVIRDGLQALADKDDGIERWLRDDVLPGHAEYLADPGSATSAEDVLARLASRRRERGA